jgi:hypothetical protein
MCANFTLTQGSGCTYTYSFGAFSVTLACVSGKFKVTSLTGMPSGYTFDSSVNAASCPTGSYSINIYDSTGALVDVGTITVS